MTEKLHHPWILENFIQIKSFPAVSKAGNSLKYAIDNWPKNDLTKIDYDSVLDISKRDWQTISDPVSYAKESIDNGTYLYTELNEYYLSEKLSSKKTTKIHFSLIYGYSENSSIFYAFGYGRGPHLQKMQFGEQELLDSCRINRCISKPDRDTLNVYSIKRKKPNSLHAFSVRSFCEIIRRFLYPTNSKKWIHGIDCYKVILSNLEDPGPKGVYIKYHVVHFLAEHKKTFSLALRYIAKTNNINNRLNQFIDDYANIINTFEDLRLFYLDSASRGKTGSTVSNPADINEIHKRLTIAYQCEKDILSKLLHTLEPLSPN